MQAYSEIPNLVFQPQTINLSHFLLLFLFYPQCFRAGISLVNAAFPCSPLAPVLPGAPPLCHEHGHLLLFRSCAQDHGILEENRA